MNRNYRLLSLFCVATCVVQAQVIFLNGTSSAGKTSIAKELQLLSNELCVHAGLDFFLPMLPRSLSVYGAQADQGIHFVYGDDEGGRWVSIAPGAAGRRFLTAMHHALAAVAQCEDIIIEDVILSPGDMQEYLRLFGDIPVYFIGVFVDQAVANAREKARGDRTLGISRGLARVVHAHTIYDFTVDTSSISAHEAALMIKHYVQHNKPCAGDTMRSLWQMHPA